jgi:hypothetical protein
MNQLSLLTLSAEVITLVIGFAGRLSGSSAAIEWSFFIVVGVTTLGCARITWVSEANDGDEDTEQQQQQQQRLEFKIHFTNVSNIAEYEIGQVKLIGAATGPITTTIINIIPLDELKPCGPGKLELLECLAEKTDEKPALQLISDMAEEFVTTKDSGSKTCGEMQLTPTMSLRRIQQSKKEAEQQALKVNEDKDDSEEEEEEEEEDSVHLTPTAPLRRVLQLKQRAEQHQTAEGKGQKHGNTSGNSDEHGEVIVGTFTNPLCQDNVQQLQQKEQGQTKREKRKMQKRQKQQQEQEKTAADLAAERDLEELGIKITHKTRKVLV